MIRYFIQNGIGVAVFGVALAMFGFLALFQLPIQLTPDVSTPKITVSTTFPGATPQDVEQDILIEQEKFLKGLPGLLKMTSTASMGSAEIVLEFALTTNQQENLVRVNNALSQVANYPENVDEPSIRTENAADQPIAWFSIHALPEQQDSVNIIEQFDYIEDTIKPRFERIHGVSGIWGTFGSAPRQLQVMLDPVLLAERGLSIFQVRDAIRSRNRDVSGGDLNEGKRRFNVRTLGRYETPEDVEATIIAERDGAPVHLRDVGYARLGVAEQRTFIRHNGQDALAFGVRHQRGSNMLAVMDEIRKTAAEVNKTLLNPRGIELTQATDDTQYIDEAVEMVWSNLLAGGLLSIGALLLFLRHVRSTVVLALMIPLCVVGSFFLINATGRSINVISLAGLAFSVGAVLDCSIVVLENIYRHRMLGKDSFTAAIDGTNEVWTAILASTLTNVVVFAPILTLNDEAGQLFRDIAIAIIVSNFLSLIVSILVIPPLAARLLGKVPDAHIFSGKPALANLFGMASVAHRFHERYFRSLLDWTLRVPAVRTGVVVSMLTLAVVLIVVLRPKTEYLPEGNQQSIRAIVILPQGYGIQEMRRIALQLEKQVQPALSATEADWQAGKVKIPPLESAFIAGFGTNMFMFSRPKNPAHAELVAAPLQQLLSTVPGVIAFVSQASIFPSDITGSRAIDLDITGPDVTELTSIAARAFGMTMQEFAGQPPRPLPGITIGQPQLTIKPDWERAAELGISAQAIGYGAWALGDGAFADEYYHDGDKMDLYLYSTMGAFDTLANFDTLRIATNEGLTVPLSELARIEFTYGPQEIRRVDQQRAVTLKIVPPKDLSLEESIDIIDHKIAGVLQKDLPAGYEVRIGGSSDKLAYLRKTLAADFLLAMVLTYLTMVLVFRHWGHPLTIMLSIPVGLTGGVLGLSVLNLYLKIVHPGTIQSMDVLTMLGFVILLGSVVNNPILIVEQALNFMEEGYELRRAIVESTLSRIRPILMTTGTTILGLLPLVINPGAGSELYRGLGMVMFGGLLLGTITTIFFIPCLMMLTHDVRGWFVRSRAVKAEPAAEQSSNSNAAGEAAK